MTIRKIYGWDAGHSDGWYSQLLQKETIETTNYSVPSTLVDWIKKVSISSNISYHLISGIKNDNKHIWNKAAGILPAGSPTNTIAETLRSIVWEPR